MRGMFSVSCVRSFLSIWAAAKSAVVPSRVYFSSRLLFRRGFVFGSSAEAMQDGPSRPIFSWRLRLDLVAAAYSAVYLASLHVYM